MNPTSASSPAQSPALPQAAAVSVPEAPVTRPVQALVIDDEAMIVSVLSLSLEKAGCQVFACESLAEARKIVNEHADIGVIFSDQRLGDGLGLDFLRETKLSHPDCARVLVTGYTDVETLLKAINEGELFRFLAKPFTLANVETTVGEAVRRVMIERENKVLNKSIGEHNMALEKANDLLSRALGQSVNLCMEILDKFDHMLASHSERVSQWVVAIGKEFGMADQELADIEVAGRLHDIGLLSIPADLHRRQQMAWDKLPAHSQKALFSHTKVGSELASFLPSRAISQAILRHHEWFNGEGYPDGLLHHEVPMMAHILAVADAYDELQWGRLDTSRFVEQNIAVRFHPEVVRVFLKLLAGNPEYALKEKEVVISQLQAGMKLTSNITNNMGVLLVPKGSVLSQRVIDSLKGFNTSDPLTQRIFVQCG